MRNMLGRELFGFLNLLKMTRVVRANIGKCALRFASTCSEGASWAWMR